MVAIETRYLGTTNYRPSRIVASTRNGQRVVINYNSADNDEMAHSLAAVALVKKFWPESLAKGDPYNSLIYAHTKAGMVFVPSAAPSKHNNININDDKYSIDTVHNPN